ncbi:MAG: hypothetical protein ACK56F_18075, partial [bacterium]
MLGRGQRQTNGKVRQISDPFAFLVQGERMSISTQVKIESLDILLKFDIDPVNYRTEKAQVDAILTNFQGLTFFTQDQALKNEYLSFFYI